MSLEFMDGFDHYNDFTNMGRKWDSSSSFLNGGFTAGRFTGNSFDSQSNTVTKTLTAQATRIIGFALQATASLANVIIAAFWDSGNTQCDLRLTSGGALQVTRNGTVLGTSAASLIAVGTWYYVEFSATINTATGAFDVHVAGASVLSQTGVNTQSTGNATSNQVEIGPGSNFHLLFDDLFVLNTSGTANNTFLGDSRIFTSLPSGDDASYKQWTPSAGTNHYANVDDTPKPDDDATYNYSSTVGQIDLYTFPAISPTGPIKGTQTVLCAREDTAGARTIEEECRSAGATYSGANSFSLTSSYSMYRQIREVDPATSAAWTVSGLNAAEFGVVVLA